jgi:hypothetical protein
MEAAGASVTAVSVVVVVSVDAGLLHPIRESSIRLMSISATCFLNLCFMIKTLSLYF